MFTSIVLSQLLLLELSSGSLLLGYLLVPLETLEIESSMVDFSSQFLLSLLIGEIGSLMLLGLDISLIALFLG